MPCTCSHCTSSEQKKSGSVKKNFDLINFDQKFYHINNQFSWLFPECSPTIPQGYKQQGIFCR